MKVNNYCRGFFVFFHTLAARLASLYLGVVTIALVAHSPHALSLTNIQVNQVFAGPLSGNKQNEPSLAQNPANPLNLIAGSNDQINEPACSNTASSSCPRPPSISISGYYASFDGGKTWGCQGLLDLSAFGEYAFGDPVQAFDSKGNAYYSTLAFPIGSVAGAAPSDLFVAKSTDGGCTYPTIAKASGPSNGIFDDKDSMAIDANPSSPFRDNVYVAWTKLAGFSNANQILFSRSADGGTTWALPVQLTPADSTSTTTRSGAAVQVGPDGTVYVIWVNTKGNDNQPAGIHMTISHDGGKTFLPLGQDISVATVTDDGIDPLPGSSFRDGARIFPSFTVAPNGHLHVVWSNHVNNHAQVLATTSTDGGQTWSSSIIAGDVNGRSAFFASVSADPNNNIDLIFQALDDKPVNTPPGAGVVSYDTYFAQSTNGGATFGRPVKVSKASSDPDGSTLQGLGAQFIGDYLTAVADSRGGGVFAVWTDARNAAPCPAVDAYRASLNTDSPLPRPNVIADCPVTFGNTDIFFSRVNY